MAKNVLYKQPTRKGKEEKMEIVVVRSEDQDLILGIAALYCQIWQEPPWNEDFWTKEGVEVDLNAELKLPKAQCVVALSQGQVIGFSWGYQVNQEKLRSICSSHILDQLFAEQTEIFYVDELAVAKEWRRRSIGRELTSRLLNLAQEQGCMRITLRTEVLAQPARKVYLSLGFRDLELADANYPTRTYWLLDLWEKQR